MKNWLFAHQTVPGDPEELARRLRHELRDLLRRATGTADDEVTADGSFLLHLGGPGSGLPVKHVRVHTGVATTVDRVEGRLRLPLRWQADPAAVLYPAFEGALELYTSGSHQADLVLVGSYRPPLGPVGELADVVALGRVADRTAQRLVTALAGQLRAALPAADPDAPPPSPAAPLLVGALTTPDPLVLHDRLRLRAAVMLLHHLGVHGAPVVDAAGDLVGVLSEADLLEKAAAPRMGLGMGPAAAQSLRRHDALTVGDACSRPAIATAPEATVADAARLMLDRGVARLVVVDDGRVAGIISRSDILRALLRTDAELEAAATALVDALGEHEVTVHAAWGEVTLDGVVGHRSHLATVVEQVRAIDGVMAVDADLSWRDNDIVELFPAF